MHIHRKPVPSQEATAAPLLHKDDNVQHVPQGWPTSSSAVKVSTYNTVWSILVDLLLLALSISFFAFALVVNAYDGSPTQDSLRAKNRLLSASKYVSIEIHHNLMYSVDYG